MKTIKELNIRWWYRLIKSVYLISFVCVAALGVFLTYEAYKPYETGDFIVVCNVGNKDTFLAWKDKQIYLSPYDLQDGLASLTDYERTELQNACGYQFNPLSLPAALTPATESAGLTLQQLQEMGVQTQMTQSPQSSSVSAASFFGNGGVFLKPPKSTGNLTITGIPPLYTITPTETTTGNTTDAILYSILALTIIAAVFELIRHIFYYIVLGSLRPER